MNIRTDLAFEARDIITEKSGRKDIDGIISENENIDGFDIKTVRVTNKMGAEKIGKPIGEYVTMDTDPLIMREKESFEKASNILGNILKNMLQENDKGSVLVAGLGNREITSDALGPFAVKNTMVTRHLVRKVSEYFGEMRQVAAIAPGVLASTGMETGEIINAVTKNTDISTVIAIDALASRSLSRLCRTVQVSNTGIIPGSGVGNHRNALDRETMGIPVIAVGVPTVVYAGTLAYDIAKNSGIQIKEEELSKYSGELIVTPRDIDENIKDMAKLIGYGINIALHDMDVNDITMFLG